MNKLTKIIAVILVLLAVCLAALAWWMGHQAPVPAPDTNVTVAPVKATYSVVVATKNLEKGKAIPADGVKLVSLPMTTNGTYVDASEVIGKIPANDIVADRMITVSYTHLTLPTNREV